MITLHREPKSQKLFVLDNPDFFSKVIFEQVRRPYERRCPVARASNEVVELLAEHWSIFAPGCKFRTILFRQYQCFYRLDIHLISTFPIGFLSRSRFGNSVISSVSFVLCPLQNPFYLSNLHQNVE